MHDGHIDKQITKARRKKRRDATKRNITKYRQTDKTTNKHTYRHTDIQTDRQTYRQTDRHTDRQRYRQTEIPWPFWLKLRSTVGRWLAGYPPLGLGMAPPASRGSLAERAAVLVVLRRGSELLHVYDRDLAQRLVAPLGPSSARLAAEADLPHLA
jgi:hypothetical protein